MAALVVVTGMFGIACGGGEVTGFDSYSGCCRYSCGNGCSEGSYAECPDTGEHRDATCSGYDTGQDEDGDGYGADEDCNDNDAHVHPDAPDTDEDGVDQDCDGVDGE